MSANRRKHHVRKIILDPIEDRSAAAGELRKILPDSEAIQIWRACAGAVPLYIYDNRRFPETDDDTLMEVIAALRKLGLKATMQRYQDDELISEIRIGEPDAKA